MKVLAVSLLAAVLCLAGSTRMWLQSEYADFEKGRIQGLSIRSDGRLSLAPKVTELFDASTAYLWALARDSKGNLYTGGGPGAKLFLIAPDGSHKKLAEFDALEIHAIAVDRKDQVFVATSPDGRIYRVAASGKSEEFYNPKQKYIWGMVFGPGGDLFVATGDAGEVHRVDQSGKGSVFFRTDETHARSIAADPAGNLIIGTDPGGLVLRVSPSGEGFVLYQMPKREVTAVAVGPDGCVYAAGVAGGTAGGTAGAAAGAAARPAATPAISPSVPITMTVSPRTTSDMPTAPKPSSSGGVDVFKLDPAGLPLKIFTNPKDTVYAIAFDEKGRLLLGTGNKGSLYRVDSQTLYTSLLNVNSTQITGLVPGTVGVMFAVAGNVGKVFRFGPGVEKEGSMESDVFDSGGFSQWGRLHPEGDTHGGSIELMSRTGNLERPQKNWSPWARADPRISSPPARFLQWKAVLRDGAELDSLEAAYLPKNVAPRIEDIETTPPNYRFPPPASPVPTNVLPATLTLPAMGKKAPNPIPIDLGTSAMNFAKGWIGARWTASDENGDTLCYTLEIRGVNEKEWKPLAEKLREKRYTFDSTAYADGEYRLRLTSSDSPSNVAADALTASQVSAPFLIDNTPPEISGCSAVREGQGIRAQWKAADALSVIKHAEYSLDGGEWTDANPVTGLSDSRTLSYDLLLPAAGKGEHTIAVRVTDDYDNQAVAKCVTP